MRTSLLDALDRWAATTSASDQAATALAVVSAALAAYLLATSLAYTAALLARAPRLARALDPVTPAMARRLAHRVVAVTLVTSTWSGGAVAVAGTAPLPPALQVPVTEPPPPEVAPPRGSTPPAPVSAAAPPSVTVVAGDHLWSIAVAALAAARGITPDAMADREVGPYWVATVEANRPSLRSGDPNLIHPGEEIHLPPPPPDLGVDQ